MSSEQMGMVIRDPWYEFNTNPDYPDAPNYAFQDTMGATLAEMGVRWVRLEFHIEGTDIDEAEVERQVARNDYFINEVAPRHNLRVLGLLSFDLLRGTPIRVLNDGATKVHPIYKSAVNDYMIIWLDRARFIADRYKGRVHAYEILNEQNRLPGPGDAISAQIAARLHVKFYYRFKVADREIGSGDQSWRDTIPVLVGGLHPRGTGNLGDPDYCSDLAYLRKLYTQPSDGFLDYPELEYGSRFPVEGIAYHPYPEEIRGSLNRYPAGRDPEWEATMLAYRLDELRHELRELGHPDVPFWITEIGYNAAFGDHDEAGQAHFMETVLPMLNKRADVAATFWFKYEDFPSPPWSCANEWGVVQIGFHEDPACAGGARYNPEGRPESIRPAFHVYRSLA